MIPSSMRSWRGEEFRFAWTRRWREPDSNFRSRRGKVRRFARRREESALRAAPHGFGRLAPALPYFYPDPACHGGYQPPGHNRTVNYGGFHSRDVYFSTSQQGGLPMAEVKIEARPNGP